MRAERLMLSSLDLFFILITLALQPPYQACKYGLTSFELTNTCPTSLPPLHAQFAILNRLDCSPTQPLTKASLKFTSNDCPPSNIRIAATSLLPAKTTAAVMLLPVGRMNQSLEPPAGAICNVLLHRKLPESRISKRSNSPHPEVQQLQSGFSPYWLVNGI